MHLSVKEWKVVIVKQFAGECENQLRDPGQTTGFLIPIALLAEAGNDLALGWDIIR